MRLMGGGNLNVDNEKMVTTLILRKTTDNGKIPESKRCQHPYITRMRQKIQMYQFSKNTFDLLGTARAEA